MLRVKSEERRVGKECTKEGLKTLWWEAVRKSIEKFGG